METDDFRSEATTPDGKRHFVHVVKRGTTWTAFGYVGADFLEGAKAKRREAAVENWVLAYEQMSAKDN